MIIIFLLTAVILQVYYYCLYIYVQGCRSGTNFLSMQDMGLDGLYIYMYGLAHLVTPESLKTLFHWCFFSFMWLRADLTSYQILLKVCTVKISLSSKSVLHITLFPLGLRDEVEFTVSSLNKRSRSK